MGLFSLFSKKPQETGDDLDTVVKPRRSRAGKSQHDEPVDPMLPEKKRARRRLIGAIALVLAAIIGLPMVFDSEPKPLSDGIDIQIPSRDKTLPAATSPMPLPPESGRAEPKSDAETDPVLLKSAPTTAAAPAEKPASEPQPVRDAKEGSETRAPSAPITPAVNAPVTDAQQAPVTKTTPLKPVPLAQATAAAATDKIAEKITEKSRGRFVVQVAAVSSQAKADQLLNRLKKTGIQSYSQKISTKDGERFRIRLGPFSSREEADKARSRLGALGLSGTVQTL